MYEMFFISYSYENFKEEFMKRLKTFLFSFLLAALSIVFIAGCSTDTSSSNLGGGNGGGTDNGGGQTTPTVTPVNEFPKNPLALLGVYDITSQSVNGISQEVTAGSEFRVNVDIARLETGFVDVLIRLSIDGEMVEFSEEVSLAEANGNLDSAFFEKVFTNMGAKVTGAYTLEFTLDSTIYTELVSLNIIQDGDILVINLDKTKNLEMGAGLDDSTETPETPETPSEPVKVESIQITTPEKSYYTGSTVTIDFTLNPSNTTETDVTYQTTYNGRGTVKAANGKGQLVLENVTQSDTVLFTIVNNQQASFNIVVVNEVESISFLNATEKIEQNQKRIIAIENYDVIKDAFSSITYSVVDGTKASINSTTGEVTGLKNGVTQVNVTAIRLDGQQLTASYELDVLGHIDWADENSLQGTYDIVFFGTNSNGSGFTAAVLRTNCDIYKNLWNVNSCPNQGTFNGNYEIPYPNDFAGRAVIKTGNGVLKVHTKVAMLFTNMGSMAADAAKNDRYQYTVYGEKSLDGWMDKNIIGTMIGRHLSGESNAQNPKYYFEQDKKSYTGYTNLDIVLFSHFEGKSTPLGNVSPDTRLILRKISSQVITMDPNSLTEEPFNKINLSLGDYNFEAPSLD